MPNRNICQAPHGTPAITHTQGRAVQYKLLLLLLYGVRQRRLAALLLRGAAIPKLVSVAAGVNVNLAAQSRPLWLP